MTFLLGPTSSSLHPVPVPSSLRVSFEDPGASSARSVSGALLPASKRAGAAAVRRLSLQWRQLSPADSASLLSVLSAETFCLSYPDPLAGRNRAALFAPTALSAAVLYAPDAPRCDIDLTAQEL